MKHPESYYTLKLWQKILFKICPWFEVRFLKSWIKYYEEDTLPEIYCEITGGILSYPGYSAKTVLQHYEDHLDEVVAEGLQDFVDDHEMKEEDILEAYRCSYGLKGK